MSREPDSNRLRRSWKAAVLFFSLTQCVTGFLRLRLQGRPSSAQRALWLHQSCRLVLRRLGFGVEVRGDPPRNGLLVSNHLSYLDILFFGAQLPCVFVAKTDVRSWPMLGLLASLGGTVFIDRRSTQSAARAAERMQLLLQAGIPVLVFPEGTSSDGSEVLRFHSSLFEPAVRSGAAITPAAIGYRAGADEESSLCYYGDIRFGPHLLKTLARRHTEAVLRFGRFDTSSENRKDAAECFRSKVAALRELLLLTDTSRKGISDEALAGTGQHEVVRRGR